MESNPPKRRRGSQNEVAPPQAESNLSKARPGWACDSIFRFLAKMRGNARRRKPQKAWPEDDLTQMGVKPEAGTTKNTPESRKRPASKRQQGPKEGLWRLRRMLASKAVRPSEWLIEHCLTSWPFFAKSFRRGSGKRRYSKNMSEGTPRRQNPAAEQDGRMDGDAAVEGQGGGGQAGGARGEKTRRRDERTRLPAMRRIRPAGEASRCRELLKPTVGSLNA